MSENEFVEYRRASLANYAEENARAEGVSLEKAMEIAKASFARLLPKGLQSRDQHLFSVIEVETGKKAGTVWFAAREGATHMAYLYEIILDESFRGRGLGREAMIEFERRAREMGFTKLGLHVFGHNTAARGLYGKLGFRETNVIMAKDL